MFGDGVKMWRTLERLVSSTHSPFVKFHRKLDCPKGGLEDSDQKSATEASNAPENMSLL